MSSILEALKKLEEEKAARLSGTGHISDRVIKGGRRSKSRPRWTMPAAMVAVAAIAALVTYLLVAGPHNGPTPARTVQLPPPPAPAVAPSDIPTEKVTESTLPGAEPLKQDMKIHAPLPPKGSLANKALPGDKRRHTSALSPKPSAGPRPAAASAARPSQEPQLEATATAAPTASAIPAPSPAAKPGVLPQPVAPAPEKTPPSPAPQAAAEIPQIKISGIGWQKDSADRMAIINGMVVKEGGSVQGARITQIFPDRVRFSQNGRQFDVLMAK